MELTTEREAHIQERHPELLPEHRDLIQQTLNDPDLVRLSERASDAHLFTRWFPELKGGKYVVVVVMRDFSPDRRCWIMTAYMARKLATGEVEWKRN